MEYEELCVAKSFSLKRNLIAGIRVRAAYLRMPMSAYVALLPLSLSPWEVPIYADAKPSPRGVVVEFDLSDG
jgi:hypothetical protein